MPRFFTLDQAHRTLPRVEESVRLAIGLKGDYQSAEDQLREVNRKLMVSGGMIVDRERIANLRNTREEAASSLSAALEAIQEFGCIVKDLDVGLLDFPTLYKGREVCLCWRLGESRIEFWHGIEEGFRGRKPIDDEFLQNHRGDAVS
jgi:hypothetical protein